MSPLRERDLSDGVYRRALAIVQNPAKAFPPSADAEDYWRRVLVVLVLTYLGVVGAGILVVILNRTGA